MSEATPSLGQAWVESVAATKMAQLSPPSTTPTMRALDIHNDAGAVVSVYGSQQARAQAQASSSGGSSHIGVEESKPSHLLPSDFKQEIPTADLDTDQMSLVAP